METKNLYSLFTSSNGVSIDTRNLIRGQIFFSLKGESFNGNNFALEALDKGASYSVIDDKSILKLNSDYPSPVVTHEEARSRALEAFKKI